MSFIIQDLLDSTCDTVLLEPFPMKELLLSQGGNAPGRPEMKHPPASLVDHLADPGLAQATEGEIEVRNGVLPYCASIVL